uniref:Aquaporin n=1 Tax=Leersia perrieri TaxID=77586 RepID=A0A0D9XGR1_9ORYZ
MASKEEVAGVEVVETPYWDLSPSPILDTSKLTKWTLCRALIAEFMATLIFLYVSIATVIGYKNESTAVNACMGVGYLGVAWSFGATIFILVYCTAGVSGGHINPAVTIGCFFEGKISPVNTVLYVVAQCLGAMCGAGIVKGIMKHPYNSLGGGANAVADGYSVADADAAADRVRGVRGASSDDTDHRNGDKSGEEPRRRRAVQPAESLARPLDLLGGAGDRCVLGGGVSQAGAAWGGGQGASLVLEHRRDGVRKTTMLMRASYCLLVLG